MGWGGDALDAARSEVDKATRQKTAWDGPTSGPKLLPGKSVIYIAGDMKNGGILGVLDGFKEAVDAAGWSLDILDGGGSVKDQLAALNQAIAKKPDAVIIGGWNPNVARIPLKKAREEGIQLVAWHAWPSPGPLPEFDIFYNVTTDSNDVARVAALYAVIRANGKAKAVIFTDSLYQIALDKANAMRSVIEKFAGSQVLEFVDTPISDTSNRMPPMTFSLLQKYGDDYQYSLAINDIYFDFMAASLRTAGKKGDGAPFNISAGDGSITAYQRIRKGEYQAATVPEPLNLHGWQLLDETNRALAGQPPSGYVTPVHLVTPENIQFDGGPRDIFDPQNNYRGEYKKIWGIR
ncbi:MAG: substrate-binding domain-containing protein [Planctomycetota bacterium]|jgi:ribose transport system substrate-binding protein|nr:substrate-binding domain-containing protein [Planctomycetota bacterium]